MTPEVLDPGAGWWLSWSVRERLGESQSIPHLPARLASDGIVARVKTISAKKSKNRGGHIVPHQKGGAASDRASVSDLTLMSPIPTNPRNPDASAGAVEPHFLRLIRFSMLEGTPTTRLSECHGCLPTGASHWMQSYTAQGEICR
jgi:hypothetical protein